MGWQNPQKRSGRFINPHIQNIRRGIWDLILWLFGYYKEKQKRVSPPPDFKYPAQIPSFNRKHPSAVWLGHSTYLVQINDITFLTDPLFSNYCSPIPFKLLKRHHTLPLPIQELPPIDYVLISHNHFDHLDEKSVFQINSRFSNVRWLVPRGLKDWFLKRNIQNVIEFDWGQTVEFSRDCRITAVPGQHFSGRALFDQNHTLWCGFVVECQKKTFYFVGDTGYNEIDFKEIGKRWSSIDLSLIPIGTYIPSRFMLTVHSGPEEAVKIHLDVHSHLSLGMHWKTFRLSEEAMNQPPYDLYLAMKDKNLSFASFLPIEPGKFINW